MTETVSKKFDMPEMTEDDFKASIYGHLHQIADTCKKSQGIRFDKRIGPMTEFYIEANPYFIASFHPGSGWYQITCPADSADMWKENFDNMLNCSHCINNKQKILAAKPDYFEGEMPDKNDEPTEGETRQ